MDDVGVEFVQRALGMTSKFVQTLTGSFFALGAEEAA